MLTPELKTKYLAALRSGEYKQAEGRLFDGKGYCCLGVLCKVAGLNIVHEDGIRQNGFDNCPIGEDEDGSEEYGEYEDAVYASDGTNGGYGALEPLIPSSVRDDYTSLNDGGATFNEIADKMEHDNRF